MHCNQPSLVPVGSELKFCLVDDNGDEFFDEKLNSTTHTTSSSRWKTNAAFDIKLLQSRRHAHNVDKNRTASQSEERKIFVPSIQKTGYEYGKDLHKPSRYQM